MSSPATAGLLLSANLLFDCPCSTIDYLLGRYGSNYTFNLNSHLKKIPVFFIEAACHVDLISVSCLKAIRTVGGSGYATTCLAGFFALAHH